MVTIQIDIFALLKFIGSIIVVVVLIFLIYRGYRGILVWIKSREYKLDRAGIKKRWQEIENLLKKPGEMNYKIAVLEADKLLDYALKSMAMPGKDLAERIRFASFKFNKLKRIWWAHGVRNQLVHEPSFHLNYGIAKKAIRDFKRALKEIGVL